MTFPSAVKIAMEDMHVVVHGPSGRLQYRDLTDLCATDLLTHQVRICQQPVHFWEEGIVGGGSIGFGVACSIRDRMLPAPAIHGTVMTAETMLTRVLVELDYATPTHAFGRYSSVPQLLQ